MEFGTCNPLDAFERSFIWIHDDHFGRPSRNMPGSVIPKTPMYLVVKTAAKNELRVQIRLGQGVSEEE
jgi:hypothetical protein